MPLAQAQDEGRRLECTFYPDKPGCAGTAPPRPQVDPEEQRRRQEQRRLEEQRRKEEATRLEEQRRREEAAREEQRRRDEAAREEQRRRDEATRLEEQRRREDAARDEQRRREEATRLEEQRRREEAARREEQRRKEEAERLEEQRRKEEAARDEQRRREEAAREEQRRRDAERARQPVKDGVAERLEALKAGDGNDVLLFLNETPEAPHARRESSGQVSFRDGRAAPCAALQWTGGPEVGMAVRIVLERHGARQVLGDVAQTPCPEVRRPYDVVAVERRVFQALPRATVEPLLKDIAEKRLTPLEPPVVTAADMAAARARLQRELDIAAGLRNGTLQGVGLLVLASSTSRICAAGITDDQRPAVLAALQRWRGGLPVHLAGATDVVLLDKAAALAAARRGECAAIFGEAAVLRDIDAALRRESAPVNAAGVWLTPPEWDELLQQAGALPRDRARRREVLASRVNPLAERLVADLQAYIAADGRAGPVGSEFAPFAQWFGQLKAARWTLAPQRFEIDDFGDASSAGGSLPSVAVIVYFALTAPNAAPAENCMIFVWLDDAGARRDSTAFRCDALSEIERWKRQRALRSKWT